MPFFNRIAMTAAAALLGSTAALADNVGLIVGNSDYEALGDIERADLTVTRGSELRGFGFDLILASDLESDNGPEALADFIDATRGADRIVVALSGRYVTDGDQSWMLYADSGTPRLFELDKQGINVERVLRMVSRRPGQTVVLLGVDPEQEGRSGEMLANGIAGLDVPGNVTVLTGSPLAVADFIRFGMVEGPNDLIDAFEESRGLEILGYQPGRLDFLPRNAGPSSAERTYWGSVVDRDTPESYRAYLDRYPRGFYVDQARSALEGLLSDPNRDARLTEERLNLSRDARRVIQRHLTVLGYNTRGVDGIFGGGTRRAVANWQQQNGFPQTSYLTADQIAILGDQATARASELEREAEREAERQREVETAFWQETGARGDVRGLRAYLDRYPDGRFADEASRRLAAILQSERENAGQAELQAWADARRRNTERAYMEFLARYPDSQFEQQARQMIAQLRDNSASNQQQNDRAQAAENGLGLNDVTRRLIEARLDQLGLDPGRVDGRFDENSRSALRRYQRDRGLNATGYMDEGTLIRLLADSFGELR